MNKKRIVALSCVLILLTLTVSVLLYLAQYTKADSVAVSNSLNTSDLKITTIGDRTVIEPLQGSTKGIIFYPGGDVEHTAYLPLLTQIALKSSVNVYLIQMPFELAIFNVNAAAEVIKDNPAITAWYLCGHSLGGAMISAFYMDNLDTVSGLILLGSYPSDNVGNILSIYGSNDLVLNRDKVIPGKIIEGGNHAYFGNYGEQKGDGVATITREAQQRITIEYIEEFVK